MDDFLGSLGRIAEQSPSLLVVIIPAIGLYIAWRMEGKLSKGADPLQADVAHIKESLAEIKTTLAILMDRSDR